MALQYVGKIYPTHARHDRIAEYQINAYAFVV